MAWRKVSGRFRGSSDRVGRLGWVLTAADQVCKTLRTFRHTAYRMIHFGRCIPQNIKFNVGRQASVRLYKLLDTGVHNLPGNGQGVTGIVGISSRPIFGANLKPGDFTATSHGVIIVSGLQHRQSFPPVHTRSATNHPQRGQRTHGQFEFHSCKLDTMSQISSNELAYSVNITDIVHL